MAARLNPYLNFKDTARAAMEFYRDALGGELLISTFGEYGDTGPNADGVMHAMLQTPAGFTLMASDVPPGMGDVPGNGTVSLSGDDEEQLRGYWDKLSAGGSVAMPLEKQMWGDVFGHCIDKFGVSWMVNIAEPQG